MALLHGPEQIADLPVPVVESPGAVRIGHPERGHLVEYLAPNSVFNSLPREFEEGSNQNRLRDQDIEHISGTFHAYADVEKYARVVPLAEIERNDWNLNISRYVDTSEEEERIDVAKAVRKLRELEQERAAAEATMNRYLAELGYDA